MMEAIELEVETDENGELRLTKEQLGNAQPRTRFRVSARLVKNRRPGSLWATMTSAERARDLQALIESFPSAPDIPLEALRRENLYD